MTGFKNLLSKPLGSAMAGGLVVFVLGWAAIASGAIDVDNQDDPAGAQPPLTQPVSDSSGAKGLTVNEIYERDSRGVAFITAQKTQNVQSPFSPFPEEQQSTGTGSGFLIDTDGHVLTNNHVVEGASKITVTVGDGETVDATLVGSDPSSDVALLKLTGDTSDLHPLQLGDSSKLEVGDPVVAIGNPFGLDRTVTSGIVSALQREISAPNGFSISDVIQTDAPINPGNSGGPLIDASGRVVGINSQIQTGGGQGSVGIGFAVPANTAQDVVQQLLTTGKVQRAYLGLAGGDLTPELADTLNLDIDRGALVTQAYPGSPAADAGLEGGQTQATIDGQQVALGGDVIVKIDGEEIEGMDDVVRAVNESQPGDELTLTVHRDGEDQEIKVTLGERPTEVEGAGAQAPGQ
jgi:S1-C subfamily serine protease